MTNKINGIDVSECKHLKNDGIKKPICRSGGVTAVYKSCLCKDNTDCYYKQLKRLQEENEKIKKQYNCYACGNCNGKEDYINLEKHHKGLRKQFDELVKRNNTLSLRIEELEKENEELKNRLKTLDEEEFVYEVTEIEYNNFKKMNKYKQTLEEIRKEYTNSIFYQCDKTEEECPCHNCIILGQLDRVQNIVKIIDEVLNDRD